MAKGNYTAYQQLKPAEIKVGEFYNNWVDGYVKRGEANRAAQAKLLADHKKEIGDRFNAMKIDPYATLANFSDFAQTSFVETADFVGTQRMLADRDPSNAQKYLMLAENAVADYKSLASTFGNKDFIDKANQKQQALASNDVFSESDNNEQLAILGQAIPEYRRDPNTGRMKFGLPKSGVATDEDPLEWKSTGEIVSLWTSPDEINLLKSNKSNGNNGFLDKQVFDVAKQMSDEYSRNYDGNRTNAKTWFSEKRGNQWFDTSFGEFNPNNIHPIIKQYAKSVLKKSINGDDAEAVYQEAKKGIIDNVASLVGTEEKVDTRETAADREEQAWRIKNAKKQYYKQDSPSSSAPTVGGGGMYNSGNQTAFIKDRIPNMEKGKDGKMTQNGYKTVIRQAPMRILSLPKQKGMPTTENVFGITTYRNKKGEIQPAYYLGTPAKDGKIVTSRINENELNSYFVKLGYNPIVAKQYLLDNSQGEIPYIGTQAPKTVSREDYQNLDIFFKTKESGGNDSEGVLGWQ